MDADPIELVRRYREPDDLELAAFVAALFAFGRVASLRAAVRAILEGLGPSPARGVVSGVHRSPDYLPAFRYRWCSRDDLIDLLEAYASLTRDGSSLGASLAAHRRVSPSMEEALAAWVLELRTRAAGGRPLSRGLRFLLAHPSSSGACKRWFLLLRWLIRPDDGLDLGLWSDRLDPAELTVPLDAHWARIGPRLGWTRRRTPGRAMAIELTDALRRADPADPLRFDFAVCHLGISGGCPPRVTRAHCEACPLAGVCASGRRRLASALRGRPNAPPPAKGARLEK